MNVYDSHAAYQRLLDDPAYADIVRIRMKMQSDRPYQEDCWKWTAKTDRICVDGMPLPAARVAWILEHKRLPPSSQNIVRTCGNLKCVNPRHLTLFLTRLPEIDDSTIRAIREADTPIVETAETYGISANSVSLIRAGRIRPEAGGRTRKLRRKARKLTDEQVGEIRLRRHAGEQMQPLADDYGISISMVSRIMSGERR